jgi:hypothetical protein
MMAAFEIEMMVREIERGLGQRQAARRPIVERRWTKGKGRGEEASKFEGRRRLAADSQG